MDLDEKLNTRHQGFRDRYLDYEELSTQLQVWAAAFPDIVKRTSLGQSEGGREIWLLTLGNDPERVRPTAWIDGNLHASEVCGSSAALAIAETIIHLHLNPGAQIHGLSKTSCDQLRRILFYVVPRISPDGAEAVLKTARYVRSVPENDRPNRGHSFWRGEDIDGDGLSLVMRKKDRSGEFVESTEVEGLMLPRTIEDEGPYYKVYPEGVIENFDGSTIPDPDFLSDNDTDLNRNFPWSWAPEPTQVGAGGFPGSRIESRALIEFTQNNPQIFFWLNYHTFGGVFIRPLGHGPDSKMDQSDLALYRQIGAWAEADTGYPTVSAYEEFLYEPDKVLHGDVSDYAYHQRGCVSYVVELWDIFARLNMAKPKKFVDYYTHLTRQDMNNLGKWDQEHNQSRMIRPWKTFLHPQLDEVEVGGLNPLVGCWNPPYEMISEVLQQHTSHALRVASLAPHIVIEDIKVESIKPGVSLLSMSVENIGYLPSYILSSAKTLPWNEVLWADIELSGCRLSAGEKSHKEVGHLDGWGRGLFDDSGAIYYQRSRGSVSCERMTWVIEGRGEARVVVGNCRMGEQAVVVQIE